MARLHRLPNYDYGQEGCYFITFCTKRRATILSRIVGRDDPGAPYHLELLPAGRILEGYLQMIPTAYPNITMHHSVIMPNHVHLLLSVDVGERTVKGAPRSSRPTQLVPRMITALKRFTNQDMQIDLWQDGFHDHIIRNEADYLRIWAYIDQNPAKWREDCYYEEGIA